MSVTVTFSCGGCDATAQGTAPLRCRFISFSGQDHGFGQYHTDRPQDVAPEGWMPFDPYTQATYCPACWREIEEGTDAGLSG